VDGKAASLLRGDLSSGIAVLADHLGGRMCDIVRPHRQSIMAIDRCS
jgi:hypothetical protein